MGNERMSEVPSRHIEPLAQTDPLAMAPRSNPWDMEAAATLAHLLSSPQGLTAAEARQRLDRFSRTGCVRSRRVPPG